MIKVKTLKTHLYLLLSLSLMSGSAFSAMSSAPMVIELTEQQQQTFGLQFAPIQTVGHSLSPNWNGLVTVPSGQSHVMSAGAGGLLHLSNLTEGARIEPGQVLAQIDSPHSLTLQREALAVLSDLDLAKQNLARDEDLADSGVVAQKRLQMSRAQVANLSRQLDEVWQNLALMGMSSAALTNLKQTRKLQSARLNLTATAPGLVVEVLARSGERVSENQPILQWQQTFPLWLSVPVSIEQAQRLSVGQMAILNVNQTGQGADRPANLQLHQGEIIMIDGRVEPVTQSVRLVIALPPTLDTLRPGQSLAAQFVFAGKDLVSVPASSIIHFDDQAWLFVKQGARLQAVSVELLQRDQDRATVRFSTTITESAQVVSKGTAALRAILEEDED